jgi:Mn2+/Fe2+ NRAMP family transporter
MMIVIVANTNLMGRFEAKPWLIVLGWLGIAIIAAAVVALPWSF